jgi:hypothetical protein
MNEFTQRRVLAAELRELPETQACAPSQATPARQGSVTLPGHPTECFMLEHVLPFCSFPLQISLWVSVLHFFALINKMATWVISARSICVRVLVDLSFRLFGYVLKRRNGESSESMLTILRQYRELFQSVCAVTKWVVPLFPHSGQHLLYCLSKMLATLECVKWCLIQITHFHL